MQRSLMQVVLRHKRAVVIWSFMVIGLSVAAILVVPRKYGSEAKLFLRLGRESVTLDPTATTGATVQVQESRENQINSTRDMLKSRVLLERVVETLGPEAILKGPAGSEEKGLAAVMSRVMDGISELPIFNPDPISRAEKAVSKLSKSFDVSLARNSSVITVDCEAKSPKQAQKFLEVFLDAYQKQHALANRTAGSLEFFSVQSKTLKDQLDTAVAKLRDAKNDSSIVSIPVEQQALQSQVTQIEAAEMAADAALAANAASIASLQKSLRELPTQVTTEQTTGFPNAAADSMRQELFKLQMSIREQQAKLGDEHPLVAVMREQARQSEKILNSQKTERTQTTNGINTSRQSLELDLRRQEALDGSLRAKTRTLKQQYADLQQRMKDLNAHEVRVSELQRNADIAAATYREYVDHLEQARISEALETNRISNVNVVQPPTLVMKAVSPTPRIILGLGFLVAVVGSLGLAFCLEYFNSSPRSMVDMELDESVRQLARFRAPVTSSP